MPMCCRPGRRGTAGRSAVQRPWLTLIALGLVYLSMFPFSYRSFRRLTAEAQRIAGVAPPEEMPPAA